jgi:predicted phage terminase large subunit-like protein
VATSVGGTITGKGCSRMVIDDLINPMEAESKAVRERSVEFYKTSLTTRLDNEKEGAVVIVEQRTHRNDLSGNVLLEKEWVHLSLPALNEKHRTVVFPMSRTAKVRATGDLLWEEKHGAEDLNRQKIRMGSRAFNAQFQQSPVSDEGSLFKRSWWSYYRELPKVRRRGWFWDTAVKTREQNDFTVGLLLAECADGFYLERLVKEKMEYPDLRRTVQQEQEARPANVIVVEDKSSGQQVIQELRRYTRLPIVAFDPGEKDKVLRANLVSPTVEAGKVFLPEGQPWVADFIETLAGFPDVEHDDEVDAFTSGLLYFNGRSNGGQPQVTVV